MKSCQFLDRVRDSSSSFDDSRIRHGCSKSQKCLLKILHVIKIHPPLEPNTVTENTDRDCALESNRRSFDACLDLRLGSFTEPQSDCEDLSASSAIGESGGSPEEEKSSAGEGAEAIGDGGAEEEFKIEEDVGEERVRTAASRGHRLDLLIEATEMVEKELESEGRSGRGGENSGAVTSKRGRRQVLPQRYRDSVLLVGLAQSQRSSLFSTKRKRK